jgi:hypothetical protein
MRLRGTRLVRLGAVHAVALAALAFATPAHAADDPPLPVTPAAAPALTPAAPDGVPLAQANEADAQTLPIEQESPGKTLPSAPATARLDNVRQGWTQVIPPTHAQKSPDRASTRAAQGWTLATPPHQRQYHSRPAQYQRLSSARKKSRALVLPTVSISPKEPLRIPRSPVSIGPPNRSQNEAQNCNGDPDGYWSPELPADDGESVGCASDPPSDEATSDGSQDTPLCADAQGQYQPDETQYQAPPAAACSASDNPVVPTPEPDVTASTDCGCSSPSAPTSVVTPMTTEPSAAPAAPGPESTQLAQPGAAILSAPDSPQPATAKVAPSRRIAKPSRPRPPSPELPVRTERVTPVQVRAVSPRITVRARPPRAARPKPKVSMSRSKVLAAEPQSLEPASSHEDLFGGWLLLALPLSFLFALGLLLPVAAIAGRSLRARVRSKGLSGNGRDPSSSGGIWYRD